MKDNFAACMGLVFKEEGGYVNNKWDPGKATNRGITQGTWDLWEKEHGQSLSRVERSTIADATAIYQAEFWNGVSGDLLPLGVDLMVFNEAVMSGCAHAIKMMQLSVGQLVADGQIGLKTRAMLGRVSGNRAWEIKVIDGMHQRQLGWLRHLPTWAHFGRGWTARELRMHSAAYAMVEKG